MGIPTDTARASKQHLGRAWSSAFWSHDTKPDGIIYKSRMNNDTNIAIYDRALTKLTAIRTSRLVDLRSDLASIIKDFNLAII
jgi:RES domain